MSVQVKKTPIIKAKPLKLDYNTRLKKKYGRSVKQNFEYNSEIQMHPCKIIPIFLVAKYKLQTNSKNQICFSNHLMLNLNADGQIFLLALPIFCTKQKIDLQPIRRLFRWTLWLPKSRFVFGIEKGEDQLRNTSCHNEFPAAVSQCTLATPETLQRTLLLSGIGGQVGAVSNKSRRTGDPFLFAQYSSCLWLLNGLFSRTL